MGAPSAVRPTGHAFRVEGVRGPVWNAKYRLPDGRQVQRKLGPASTERGRPAACCFTKRTAEDWLGLVLEQARHGTLPGMVRAGATFADATAEWLRYVEHDRVRKPSRVAGCQAIARSLLLPRFAEEPIESITPATIEAWLGGLSQTPSTRSKALVLMHGIFQRAQKVWCLPVNPATEVEKPPVPRGGDIQVFSPEAVWALVRTAAPEQDAALVPHRCVHRPADGGAGRAPLARRRVHRPDGPCPLKLRRGASHDSQRPARSAVPLPMSPRRSPHLVGCDH